MFWNIFLKDKRESLRNYNERVKIKIYLQYTIKSLIALYKRELNTKILKSDPSYENKIIEENKMYFSHIGYAKVLPNYN